MKGGLAAMMGALHELRDQRAVRVELAVVPDEESEEEQDRGTEHLIRSGHRADFAITGEPTDLHIGIQAKGVLAMRLEVAGTAAHGATPWLGDNAILKALDSFRSIESLPSHARAPTSSTARRSTWVASSAETRSTRCPTPA